MPRRNRFISFCIDLDTFDTKNIHWVKNMRLTRKLFKSNSLPKQLDVKKIAHNFFTLNYKLHE